MNGVSKVGKKKKTSREQSRKPLPRCAGSLWWHSHQHPPPTHAHTSHQRTWGFPPCLPLGRRTFESFSFYSHLLHGSSSLIFCFLVPSKSTQNRSHERVALERTFAQFSGFHTVFFSTPGVPGVPQSPPMRKGCWMGRALWSPTPPRLPTPQTPTGGPTLIIKDFTGRKWSSAKNKAWKLLSWCRYEYQGPEKGSDLPKVGWPVKE